MFVTIGGIAQLVEESSGLALIGGGIGTRSTAMEAAQAVNRAVYSGDKNMSKINDAFKAEYGPDLVQAV